jgi:hypothetical protein
MKTQLHFYSEINTQLHSHGKRSMQYPVSRSTVGVMSERSARTGAVDTKSGTAPGTAYVRQTLCAIVNTFI